MSNPLHTDPAVPIFPKLTPAPAADATKETSQESEDSWNAVAADATADTLVSESLEDHHRRNRALAARQNGGAA